MMSAAPRSVRKNSVILIFQAVTDPVYRIMMAVSALEDTGENGHSQLAFVIVIWPNHLVIIRGACEFTFGDHLFLYLEIWTRNLSRDEIISVISSMFLPCHRVLRHATFQEGKARPHVPKLP